LDYFYDGQVRRYIVQFMRIFSEIKSESGPDENGTTIQKRVPIVYGDPSWMAAQILSGGTENASVPSPIMAAWIYSLQMDKNRRYAPKHESSISGIERNWDPGTKEYGSEVGNRFTVERYMPVPYKLNMQLDIWTTTTTTKLQILEQILMFFNPGLQLKSTSNYFDWTSTFEIEMTNIMWTNRSVPQGSEMERDVASIQFELDIWVSPPAKIKRFKVIEEIVTNFHLVDDVPDKEIDRWIENPFECVFGKPDLQFIVTPGNFKIKIGVDGYAANEIVLLNQYGEFDDTLRWDNLFATYGNLKLHSTLLRLKQNEDIEVYSEDIVGRVTWDKSRPYLLTYEIDPDTLPSTTQKPVLKRIDPLRVYPGSGLPVAVTGQRYLISGDRSGKFDLAVGAETIWKIDAYNNDIIEYDGNDWFVAFDSNTSDVQYVINLLDNNHYKWTGNDWVYTYLGEYDPGYWKLQNMEVINDPTDENGGGSINPIFDNPDCSPKSPRTT